MLFYGAEIILALNHIHRFGFIYRDLKPSNVILCKDGHVKLIDLGGMVDSHGSKKDSKNSSVSNSLFMHSMEHFSAGYSRSDYSSAPASAMLSIMGTQGYMAPELMDGGYSKSVDYWALGVTMFELLYGRKPFQPEMPNDEGYSIVEDDSRNHAHAVQNLVQYHGQMDGKDERSLSMSFGALFNNFIVKRADNMDYLLYFKQQDGAVAAADTIDVLARLLIVNPKKRLGGGAQGFKQLKNHPFFSGVSWELLECKKVKPPRIPDNNPLPTNAMFGTFEEMTSHFCKDASWQTIPSNENQRIFKNW